MEKSAESQPDASSVKKKMKNLPPESRNFAENVERIRVAILARRIFFAFGLSESVSVIQA